MERSTVPGGAHLVLEGWDAYPDLGLAVVHSLPVEERRVANEAEGLQRLAARLVVAAGAREVLRAVVAAAPAAVGAATCTVLLPGVGGGWLRNRGVSVQSMRSVSWQPVVFEPDGPEAGAIESGSTVLCRSGVVTQGVFPVVGRNGLVLGAFSFRWHDGTGIDERRLELLESVGVLCGEALQRGALHDRERSARVRTTMLQRATMALARARSSEEVLDAVAHHGAPALGVVGARLVLDGPVGAARVGPGVPATEGSTQARNEVSVSALSRRGEEHAQVLTLPVQIDGLLRARLELAIEPSDVLAPLLPGEAPLDNRAMDSAALVAFVELCAQALERCRLAEVEHDIAVELQRAMLGSPDRVDEMHTGLVYLPSESQLEVGGDWADVVRIAGGRIALVVGDVVGHSIGAATLMGQLRSAVRALLAVPSTLPQLLSWVDSFAAGLDGAEATTLAVVVLDPVDGSFEYLCAGHPPPVHRRTDGSVVLLDEGRNAPIGCASRRSVTVGQGVLGPGDLLVLYTDGLVERRGAAVDDGIDDLCTAVAALTIAPESDGSSTGSGAPVTGEPSSLCDAARWLTTTLLGERAPDDDVCVLLVAPVMRPGLRERFLADPRRLGGVRRALRDWCHDEGLDEEHTTDVLVVVGEALANAVEHAYADEEPGPVTLDAWLDADRSVVVRVGDQGTWRRPVAAELRGHGTRLMRTLSSRFEVERFPTGTIVRATVPSTAR